MTLFGIIWVLLTIGAFVARDVKYIIALTIYGMVFQSNNAIVIGGVTGIGPQFLSCGAFIVRSLNMKSRKYNKHLRVFFFFLFSFILYITFNSAFISKGGFNIIQVAMLWVYYITLYRLAKVAYLLQYESAVKLYKNLVIFVLCVGFFLLLQMIGFIPDVGITEALFYNDTIGNCYYQDLEQDRSRFTATFLEPSYCAPFLVGALYFFMIVERGDKKSLKLLIPIVLAVILTFSSTAFGALGIGGILYLLSKGDKKILRYAIPLGLVVVGIFFSSFYSILDQVIFSKSQTGSAMVRANYNLAAMEVFGKYPIWGQGYGTQRGSSIIYTILGELGLVGVILYSMMAIAVLNMTIFKKGLAQHYYGAALIVICAITSQIIACPDFSLCTFWLALFLIVVFVGCKNGSLEHR